MEKLKGYRTYLGLAIIVLGWLGLGDLVSETELSTGINSAIELFGIIMAIYGRVRVGK